MDDRGSRRGDVALIGASVCCGAGFLAIVVAERSAPTVEVVVQVIVGAVTCVALWWRRRWPVQLAITMVPLALLSTVTWLVGLVFVTNVADLRRLRTSAPIAAAFFAPNLVTAAVWPDPEASYAASVAISAALVSVALAIGVALRARHQLAADRLATLERSHTATIDAARRTERTRIAREMHDVLGHRLSILAMHAGALEHRSEVAPPPVVAAARVVREQASLALRDLANVIGVLRADGVSGNENGVNRPQPGLADVAGLVEESRLAGMRVDFTMAAETDAVDADGGRHAFRLVQEALTNARKHAPGMPVVLDIHADDGVTIDVRNRLATVNGSTIDELAAMTERATLGGGTVEHTVVDGELRVTAHLPKREP